MFFDLRDSRRHLHLAVIAAPGGSVLFIDIRFRRTAKFLLKNFSAGLSYSIYDYLELVHPKRGHL